MKVISMQCDASKIALAIFSFNRPQHLRVLYQAIEKLEVEHQYCFHLFNDGPKTTKTKDINLVHELTDKFSSRTSNYVISRQIRNLGLAKSIRSGLDSVFTKHDKAIILEDDIIPTKIFFNAMEFYLCNDEFNSSIGSITGANTTKFPLFDRRDFLASKRQSSWGWATWSDRWLSIDWNFAEKEFLGDKQLTKKVKRVSPDLVRYAKLQQLGKIDSWATAMNVDFIKRDLLCIVPRENLITNIGLDGSGTHGGKSMVRGHIEMLKKTEPTIEFIPKVHNSFIYDFLVKKDNSLMRDFPRGNVLRLLGNLKSAFLK